MALKPGVHLPLPSPDWTPLALIPRLRLMLEITLVLQATAVLSVTWVAWKALKGLTYKHPLSNVAGPESQSWVTGSMMKFFDEDGWEYMQRVTDKYGSVFRFTGLFQSTNLFVYDPKALHHMLVKDSHIYEEALDFAQVNEVILGAGLISTLGAHHRKQRKLLTPVFSTANIREMTPTFYRVAERLRKGLTPMVVNGAKEIDMLEWISRTSLETIGQSGFGYSFGPLDADTTPHPFYVSIKEYVRAANDNLIVLGGMLILPYILATKSPKFWRTILNILPSRRLHQLRDISDTLHRTAVEIYESTKRSLGDNGELLYERIGGGKDIMSVLLRENLSASNEDKLPESELLGQIATLTLAAMDTTSNALARILHLLSQNPDAQETLRQELTDMLGGQTELGYDVLSSLPYLDAVCKETLRLHAPVPLIAREVQQDDILPFSKSITTTDGKTVNELFVPKRTEVFISLLHCNRNPEIWGSDVLEWKPERWLAPLPDTVFKARIPGVYSHLMTFNAGHRSCIGFKFSELNMKVMLSVLLTTFRFAPGDKDVEWQNNGIVQPTTEDAELTATGKKKLQLPLKVTLL